MKQTMLDSQSLFNSNTDFSYFNNIVRKIRDWSVSYGYNEIFLDEFIKISKIKKTWDLFSVVNKDFIVFENKKEKLCLRPDNNLSFVSQCIDYSKLLSESTNYKFFYINKFYSFPIDEKSKNDEYHDHFGFYSIGEIDHASDVETINMSYYLLKELDIDAVVKINITGCSECSKKYKNLLLNYLKTKKSALCNECVKNITKNPLAVLSCENKVCKKITSQAPVVVDNLCDSCRDYSMKIIEFLDDLNISYVMDPFMFDKTGTYNNFYFEIETQRNNAPFVLGRGGHLEEYSNSIGFKKNICGADFDISNIIKRLKEYNKVVEGYKPEVYLVQIGETARKKALNTFIALKNRGISCFCSVQDKSIVKQIASAKAMGARLILILGQQEVVDNTILIRDTVSNVQEVVNYNNLIDEVKKKLVINI